ncbi:MAG: hypothetical protein DRG09_01160 [Epsilonproteobacteria bacterium]|nr:MAG: hypothetical protein DRG09_01160 [Campylobacterota bacterium]
MKKLIRMITPFIAILFLVACSSSDSVINDIVDDIVDNPTTSDPKFTSDLLVGKTYTETDEGVVTTVTFTETDVTIEEDGETLETLSYVINEDGVLVLDGDELHTLISIDENGDLHVQNDGVESVWVLTDDNPTAPPPTFTSDLLVGKTYTINDGDVSIVTFTETVVNVEGEVDSIPYEIKDGVLVLEETDFHTLISIEDNGDLKVENDGTESVWVLTV